MSSRLVTLIRNRLLRNRVITWSVIGVLLMLMLLEWQSRRSYYQTLSAFEAALAERDPTKLENNADTLSKLMNRLEAKRLVHGWVWESTDTCSGQPLFGWRWPSLFRTYRIWLPIHRGCV